MARFDEEVVVTGAINWKGNKNSAIKHTKYRIADGNPDFAFVRVSLLIRKEHRIEIQKEATRDGSHERHIWLSF